MTGQGSKHCSQPCLTLREGCSVGVQIDVVSYLAHVCKASQYSAQEDIAATSLACKYQLSLYLSTHHHPTIAHVLIWKAQPPTVL